MLVFPFNIVQMILGKVVIYLWYGFDFIVLLFREIVLPFLVYLFKLFKKPLSYIWKFLVYLYELLMPKCNPSNSFCPRFNKALTYEIAMLEHSVIKIQNKDYENELRKHYQQEIDKLKKLNKLYETCKVYKRDNDINNYNEELNDLQVSELNIAMNYAISVQQHRITLLRNGNFNDFSKKTPLLFRANQQSSINEKVLI